MRYIHQQKFITTVVDQEIYNQATMKQLLVSLQSSSEDVHFSYIDARNNSVISHAKTRIKEVNNDCVTVTVFQKTGTAVVRNISFVNIVSIKLVTENYNSILNNLPLICCCLPEKTLNNKSVILSKHRENPVNLC